MTANAEMIDTGIARPGIRVARTLRNARKMMMTTRIAAIPSVCSVSRMERLT